jgi:sugar-phosphatase
LVDSTAVVERIWRTWATSWDIDVAQILRVCHGRRSQDTIALFLPVGQQAVATEQLAQLELQDVEDVVAMPGADEMLRYLAADRWAAVTSGSRELMEARLDAANRRSPRSWWLVRMSATATRSGGYVKAAARLDKDIRRCLVIEDAPTGHEAGLASGARVLAVTTTHEGPAVSRGEFVVPDLASCVLEHTARGLVVTARR